MFQPDRRIPREVEDYFLGLYLLDLLEREWIARRVDTVELLDDITARQHVTIDANLDSIRETADDRELATSGVLRDDSILPVPLAMLRKDLLMDFDMVDPSAMRAPVPTRDEDSYGGASLLFAAATDILDEDEDHRGDPVADELLQRFYDITYHFPDQSEPLTSQGNEAWSEDAKQQWATLQEDPWFVRLLTMFAEDFILFARVPVDRTGTALYKFSYLSSVDIHINRREAFAIDPITFDLPVKGVRSCRSHHLRFAAPSELEVTSIDPPSGHNPVGSRKLAHHRAHVYINEWQSDAPTLEISLRPTASGFLRVAMLATLLTFAVQLMALVLNERIASVVEAGQADAAVTLLLVVPTLVSAYAARPGPHRLANRALARVRLVVGGSSLIPYVTAGLFLLKTPSGIRTIVLSMSLVAASAVALYGAWIWRFARMDEHEGPAVPAPF